MSINPDGFIGAVMAVQGITDASVLLHGQNGCRKGLLIANRLCPRPDAVRNTGDPVYAGTPVVPFSGINQGDYTGKSLGKLGRAMERVSKDGYELVALMCSPGISIVGDDCLKVAKECGLGDRCTVIHDDDLGTEAWEGFDRALYSIICNIARNEENRRVIEGTVVVTGLSIMHKDWSSVRDEIDHVLGLMGLRCVCYAGAGCTVSELRESVNAEFCVDVSPCFAEETDKIYRDLGIPVISIGRAPVGFDSVVELVKEVGRVTGRNVDGVLNLIDTYRRRAYRCVTATGKRFRGVTFHVSAPPSVKEPLVRFLEESFAMRHVERNYEILFAEGHRCVTEKASGICSKTIDIGFPSDKVDFNTNPVLGLDGTMYLLDRLFER